MSVQAFEYVGVDSSGTPCRGRLRAADAASVGRELSTRGVTVLEVAAVMPRGLFGAGVKREQVGALTRELSVLLSARIPIAQGLAGIAEHEPNHRLAAVARDLASRIEAGSPITEALAQHRGVFSEAYIQSVSAAEKSGTLEVVLGHLADMIDRQVESAKAIRRAMAYPLIVTTFIALALTVVVTFVIPRFSVVFESNGVELPLLTRVLRSLGEFVSAYWWAIGGAIAAGAAMLAAAWRDERGRLVLERQIVRVPIIGRVLTAVTASRFTRVLSIALGAGVDLIQAIEIASRATARPLFVHECVAIAEGLRGGESLGPLLRRTRFLPPFARRMLAAGKDARELSRSSDVVARHYEREADHVSRSVGTLVEPLLTAGLALVVLVVALSVFLPMWQMMRVPR